MTNSRVGVAVRLSAGAVIAAVLVVGAAAGIAFAWMPHTASPPSRLVEPAAADSQLTCSGPLLAIGRDANAPQKISAVAAEHVTATGADQKRNTLASPDASGASGVTRLVTPAQHRAAPIAAGAASASITADDVAGFAASSCAPALMESWLVGGSTDTGAADLVLLANPGSVPATVQLTLYGTDGVQEPGPGGTVIVAAGTQQVVPLAGMGLNQGAPIVRVTATGAPVRAALQSSIVRGLQPGGVDQSGMIAAASTTQVITGVRVTAEPQADPTSIVRLLAPTAGATASVTVIGVHGTTGPAVEVPLKAGAPVEAELPGLAPGDYTVIVTADQPVVAAAWQATGTGKGADFAWVTSAPTLPSGEAGTVFSVPAGPSPQLVLVADADAAVSLTRVDGGGAQKVTVVAGQTASVPLAAGTSYRLTTDQQVRAAVTFAAAGALASYPVWPQDAASAPLRVYP